MQPFEPNSVVESLPELPPVLKRIVMRHPSGLHQILDTWQGPAPSVIAKESGVTISGQPVALQLREVTPRYLLYTVMPMSASV